MPPLVSVDALRARFERDEGLRGAGDGGAATASLTSALEAIGWRAAGEDALEDVASLAVRVIAACVRGDHDVVAACRGIADLLRRYAPGHTDALPPVDAFIPAAAEVLRRYVGGQAAGATGASGSSPA